MLAPAAAVMVVVSEPNLIPLLDDWIAEALTPESLKLTSGQMAHALASQAGPGESLGSLRSQRTGAKARLERIYELMEDPDYPVERAKAKLAAARSDLDRIDSVIASTATSRPSPDAAQLEAALAKLPGLAGLLALATPIERKEIYEELGLVLTYRRTDSGEGSITATLGPCLEAEGGYVWCRRGDLNPHAPKGTSPSS